MQKLLPAVAVLVFASSAAMGKPPGKGVSTESDQVHLRYAITLIGLPLGTAQVNGVIGPSAYRLEATGRLTGLAGVLLTSRGAATATGSLAGGRVSPATFAATAATSRDTLTIRIAMAGGAAKGVEIVPRLEPRPDQVPLSDADKRDIVDPLSSFVMAVPGVGDPIGPAACNRNLPIFDGGVRFNVTLSFTGMRQVSAPGYGGPVAVCAARYTPVAGHRPERPATKFMTENKEMEVWLAPVGRTRFVMPFRISVMTMIGTTVIEATEFGVSALTKAAAATP